jgi:hypothetical protein
MGGSREIHFAAADQTTAAAAVIQRNDLGWGWTGGPRKPDLATSSCPGFDPKESDLVVTGAAESTFTLGTREFDGRVVLMRTPRMVSLDWQRSIPAPGWLPCLRHSLATLGGVVRVVSARPIAFPHLALRTAAFRGVLVGPVGKTTRYRVDYVVLSQGRAEISLFSFAPETAKPSAWATEIRLARLLVKRASV